MNDLQLPSLGQLLDSATNIVSSYQNKEAEKAKQKAAQANAAAASRSPAWLKSPLVLGGLAVAAVIGLVLILRR